MTKRLLATVLAVLMLCGVLASCNNASSTSSTASTASTTTSSKTESKTSSTEKKEISIGLAQNTYITSYDDNHLTKKLEEELNCDITFSIFTADGMAEKVQLMISAGDALPDVFAHTNLADALTYEYGSNGTFIDLTDYYDDPEAMPNFNAIESEEDKQIMRSTATFANNEIYSLTMWQPENWNLTPYRIYMNTTWLENLGKEVPTTTEELYDTLVAFANEDPNGNGTKDEIAALAQFVDNGGYGCNLFTAIMNSYIFTGNTLSGLTLSYDGKQVIAPWTTDEWKEGLSYLNKLYTAGAITTDSFTVDSTGFKALINYEGLYDAYDAGTAKSLNVVGMLSAGSDGGNFPNGVENRNFAEYYMIKAVKGPDGYQWSPYDQYAPGKYWFITEDCADPDFAVTMGDIFYRWDYSMTVRFGEQGVEWTDDEDFCQEYYDTRKKLVEDAGYKMTVGYDGVEDTTYRYLILISIWNTNTNKYWGNAQPRYISLYDFNRAGEYKEDTEYKETYRSYVHITNNEYNSNSHPDYVIPQLKYTDDEQAKIASAQVDIPTYVCTSFTQFVTGELDINTQWNEYLKQLETYGLSTYLEAAQTAYERTTQFENVK